MNRRIFVMYKNPVTKDYIPQDLDMYGVIREYEVLKRTEKGYRLAVSYSIKGSMFLDEKYHFFDTYPEALDFVCQEAAKVSDELEKLRQQAVQLMQEAYDKKRNFLKGGAI
ncbi:TPA: hypothetical protein I3599_000540 [Enterobacter cloacae]|nr:hypothetical protein [Enterobacter cloacae]